MSTSAIRTKTPAAKVDLDAMRQRLERLGMSRAAEEIDGVLTPAVKPTANSISARPSIRMVGSAE